MNYANIVKDTTPNAYTGGYKNTFLFAPRADFLSIKKPVPDGTLGSTLLIATAHTFTAPKGFLSWACKTNSVTLTGQTVGDDGAQEMEWTATFVILGDNNTSMEQILRQLNDDMICLLKEANCLGNDSYVQLGDECVSPVFKSAFDAKTTKEGLKEYTVTTTCKRKFFYTAAVTMSTEEEE